MSAVSAPSAVAQVRRFLQKARLVPPEEFANGVKDKAVGCIPLFHLGRCERALDHLPAFLRRDDALLGEQREQREDDLVSADAERS
jgi:hypothetical protein